MSGRQARREIVKVERAGRRTDFLTLACGHRQARTRRTLWSKTTQCDAPGCGQDKEDGQ